LLPFQNIVILRLEYDELELFLVSIDMIYVLINMFFTYVRTEFDLIEDITKVVLTKLNHNNTNEFTCNFILDDNYWSIQSLIKKRDSTEVQIIGLWGMGNTCCCYVSQSLVSV
jgi:hypothetical protein